MNNLWNTKMTIPFDEYYKNVFKEWYSQIEKNKNGRNGRLNVEKNPLDSECTEYIENIYNSGYGLKIIARELDISYTKLRTVFKDLGISIRKGQKIVTDQCKKFRSERVKGKKNPWSDWKCRKNLHSKGIQGYYIDRKNRKIWLRSTWEYIYAKWLDKQKIDWDFEGKQYKLSNGESYRPDFTIVENGKKRLVEIKGFFKDKSYKVDMLRNEYDLTITMIENIENYCINYEKELKEWKCVRIKK